MSDEVLVRQIKYDRESETDAMMSWKSRAYRRYHLRRMENDLECIQIIGQKGKK